MKPSRVSKPAIFVLLLAAVTGSVFLAFPRSGDTGISAKVARQDLLQKVTIAGTLASRRRTLVNTPYNGYVKQLFVKVGESVKQGQPLVSVAQSLQGAEPVFPLRAPYAGTVVHVQKHEGEYVKETEAAEYILRIDDLSKLYIDASAPEADRQKLKNGMEVLIKVSAVPARSYKGIITELTLAPTIEQNSGRYNSKGSDYPVRIEITDADSQIGPGMSAVVDIITAKKDAVLALRHEFIFREENEYFVTLATGQKQKVETGTQNDEVMEILSGLKEGDSVKQVDFTSLPVSE